MKVVAYDDNPKEKEKKTRLKLRQNDDGVTLIVVDDDGVRVFGGSLITFHNDGRVVLHGLVSRDIGFQLDADGHLVLTND